MGIFSKKEVPVTGTQYAEDSAKPGHDLEKPQVDHNEAYTTTARHSDAHLEAERRLIRKMDKRVPLLLSALYLVAFLGRPSIIPLYLVIHSSARRSIQHRKRQDCGYGKGSETARSVAVHVRLWWQLILIQVTNMIGF